MSCWVILTYHALSTALPLSLDSQSIQWYIAINQTARAVQQGLNQSFDLGAKWLRTFHLYGFFSSSIQMTMLKPGVKTGNTMVNWLEHKVGVIYKGCCDKKDCGDGNQMCICIFHWQRYILYNRFMLFLCPCLDLKWHFSDTGISTTQG